MAESSASTRPLTVPTALMVASRVAAATTKTPTMATRVEVALAAEVVVATTAAATTTTLTMPAVAMEEVATAEVVMAAVVMAAVVAMVGILQVVPPLLHRLERSLSAKANFAPGGGANAGYGGGGGESFS